MTRRRQRLLVAAALALPALAAAVPARAQDQNGDGVESRPVDRSPVEDKRVGDADDGSGWAWVRTGVALVIVVALVFGVRWALRRWAGGAAPGEGRAVEVLGRTSLSTRHRLYLVRMGERLLLVGGGGETLTTLAEVTDPDEMAELCRAARAGRGLPGLSWLRGEGEPRTGETAGPTPERPGHETDENEAK